VNRGERRRQAARERCRSRDWAEFHEDTAGVFRLSLHQRDRFDLAVYLAARLTGDVQAAALGAAFECLGEAAAESRLPDCLICGTPLRRLPPAIVVMLPERPDPSIVIASGICPTCAAMTDAEIMAIAEGMLRAGAWPNLRTIDAAARPAGGGHA
jgi:hypothetical protein